jgi:hypothetical protein
MSIVYPKTQSTINALILLIYYVFLFLLLIATHKHIPPVSTVLVANGISNPTVMAFAPMAAYLLHSNPGHCG